MCMRERVGGELWWILSTVVRRVSGVLMSLLGHMWRGYVRILEWVRGISLAIPYVRWEMAPGLVSGNDMWCGNLALKEAFPMLYGIACAKDTSVEEFLEISGGSIQWNVSFVRVAHN
jgi:hypothetical protein